MQPATSALIAYLSNVAAIVILSIAAAVIITRFDGTDAQLAKLVAAIGFLAAAVNGLTGVMGTFRPKVPSDQESS